MSTTRRLKEAGLIHPPSFVPHNIHYETIMGSVAYGVSSDTSDMDVYGFCIPPKDMIFPHLAGEILGFGSQIKRFEQYQEHHILDKSALAGSGRTYDITIYSIIKYVQLCMENNPNMIDSLFTPANCVLHITKVGNMVRESRHMFLHKGSWHKFKGYAYSQLHKMTTKNPVGHRVEIREAYGFDVKFAYHVVRLLNEVEQILIEGDIDLQRNREQLKSIRRGEWKEEEIREYFANKERDLEKLYVESKLPHSPDEAKIKKLLLECLEEHYGNLEDCIINPDAAISALREIQTALEKVKDLI
ncbi:MAG: nucleotidyltransferase [bacterium]|nr:MAG: nucleotidyltransferase [bacterium]